LPSPAYFHLPVVVNEDGQKLSKQTGAAPIGRSDPGAIAATVLDLLGARVPADLRGAAPGDLWRWAVTNWRIEDLRGRRKLTLPPAAE